MEKPTIFFSHASQDSSAILPIKNKLSSITANVIEIFMSSDGQSIPFGHNWVHKIEEGLNEAKIMFVFVTPTSVNSAWIYFEAGFAYSKGIEVVPVGVGVNVDQLKAPLNLLQGFDITSADSLNNFLTVVNRKFNLTFPDSFSDDDYDAILLSVTQTSNSIEISDIFVYAEFELISQYHDSTDENRIIRYDIDEYYRKISEYLDDNQIPYASKDKDAMHRKYILFGGIQIEVIGEEKEPENNRINQDHILRIRIATQNFSNSFALLKKIVLESELREDWFVLEFFFSNSHECLHDNVMISSVISNSDGIFEYIPDSIGCYKYTENFRFWIRSRSRWDLNQQRSEEYVLAISSVLKNIEANDIITLINEMYNRGLLFQVYPLN